jgi:hypothetical protein
MRRGMLSGITAAAVWAAAEPALGRAFRTSYSDVRLLGGLTGTGARGALALHLVNGAVFGALFERVGGRGPLRGMLAAQAENLALWPGMLLAQRVHPACTSGEWPPLFADRRILAYEVAAHGLFGAVLGLLLPQPPAE